MGGLVVSIAMARNPSIINRAVLIAPMLRMKCATKSMNYRLPLPQPIAHWIAYFCTTIGLGAFHSIGYPNEAYSDKIAQNTFTSSLDSLLEMEALKQKYPNIISTCVTNDWVRHSLQAQIDFSKLYSLVRTNTCK